MRGKKVTCVITVVALVVAMVSSAVFANGQTTVERKSETESSLNSVWVAAHLSDKYDTDGEFFAEAKTELKMKSDAAVKNQIMEDVNNLESCAFMKEDISKISVKDNSLQYTLDYGKDISPAYVEVRKNAQGDTLLYIEQDGIRNEMVYKADGSLFVDGNEIIVETENEDSTNAVLSPNMRSSVFSPNSFQSIPDNKYDKLIKSYANTNIELGNFLGTYTVDALCGVIIYAIKKLWNRTVPGLAASAVIKAAQILLNGYIPTYGPEDKYISFKINQKKCTSKSSGYEQFFMHEGVYYSRKNAGGGKYPHNFYEYEFLN